MFSGQKINFRTLKSYISLKMSLKHKCPIVWDLEQAAKSILRTNWDHTSLLVYCISVGSYCRRSAHGSSEILCTKFSEAHVEKVLIFKIVTNKVPTRN